MGSIYSRIIGFFAYKHLPEHLHETSKVFHDAAHFLLCNGTIHNESEMLACLRKLLEAKDCAVRSKMDL